MCRNRWSSTLQPRCSEASSSSLETNWKATGRRRRILLLTQCLTASGRPDHCVCSYRMFFIKHSEKTSSEEEQRKSQTLSGCLRPQREQVLHLTHCHGNVRICSITSLVMSKHTEWPDKANTSKVISNWIQILHTTLIETTDILLLLLLTQTVVCGPVPVHRGLVIGPCIDTRNFNVVL